MFEFEKGYVLEDRTLDWLQIEDIVAFYKRACLQSEISKQYNLSAEESLELADKVISTVSTLGIDEEDAVDMIMQVEIKCDGKERLNE